MMRSRCFTYCLYQFIIDDLTETTMWRDAASATATTLLASISSGDFVIAMVIMHTVLLITKQLSVSLQQVTIYLTRCLCEIQVVVDVITQMRIAEANFGKILHEAEQLLGVGDANKLGRTCSGQTYRGNAGNVDTAEQYYRTVAYILFLDSLLLQFNDRFIVHRNSFPFKWITSQECTQHKLRRSS